MLAATAGERSAGYAGDSAPGPRRDTVIVRPGQRIACDLDAANPGSRAGVGEADVAPVTDPVCGMTVDPATAAGHRGTGPDTVYFCSAGCAAAFDADPSHVAAAAASAPGAGAQ
jgi:P-type Cu+ transporter